MDNLETSMVNAMHKGAKEGGWDNPKRGVSELYKIIEDFVDFNVN